MNATRELRAAEPGRVPTGRLAPSPTGLLHLGHARTFLLAWWSARSQGGAIRMRIDDLDRERSTQEYGEQALFDLEWLGLDWDGPPEYESAGVESMQRAIRTLIEQGHAYPCSCTRTEVRDAQQAPQQGVYEVRYPGTCAQRARSLEQAEQESGRAPAIRLRVPAGPIDFFDGVFGPQSHDVQAEIGDFVIARRDGSPAYQLAVVCSDASQRVTEVVRGADLLPSAARQLILQRLLGLPEPRWQHVPLVEDPNGRRLAKRARDLDLRELRERGVDPRTIVAWAARSAGLQVPARTTAREVLPVFDWSALSPLPARLLPAEIESWSRTR